MRERWHLACASFPCDLPEGSALLLLSSLSTGRCPRNASLPALNGRHGIEGMLGMPSRPLSPMPSCSPPLPKLVALLAHILSHWSSRYIGTPGNQQCDT